MLYEEITQHGIIEKPLNNSTGLFTQGCIEVGSFRRLRKAKENPPFSLAVAFRSAIVRRFSYCIHMYSLSCFGIHVYSSFHSVSSISVLLLYLVEISSGQVEMGGFMGIH